MGVNDVMHLSEREILVNHLILNSSAHADNIGLMTGQMGILITVALYSRKYGIPQFENVADYLFENVAKKAAQTENITFAAGLAGIGWGIEYLIYENIMPGTGNDLCRNLDSSVMERDIRRMCDFSLLTGLAGVWKYVEARISGSIVLSLPLPFDMAYLKDWLDLLSYKPEKFPQGRCEWLKGVMESTSAPVVPDIKGLISPHNNPPSISNLCLYDGLAGYIVHKFL